MTSEEQAYSDWVDDQCDEEHLRNLMYPRLKNRPSYPFLDLRYWS